MTKNSVRTYENGNAIDIVTIILRHMLYTVANAIVKLLWSFFTDWKFYLTPTGLMRQSILAMSIEKKLGARCTAVPINSSVFLPNKIASI